MTEADWYAPGATLAMLLAGDELTERDPRGQTVPDDSFLLILHGHHRGIRFTLPGLPWARCYETVVDTCAEQQTVPDARHLPAGETVTLPGRSLLLLRVCEREGGPG
jgi:glycogen operon protein